MIRFGKTIEDILYDIFAVLPRIDPRALIDTREADIDRPEAMVEMRLRLFSSTARMC